MSGGQYLAGRYSVGVCLSATVAAAAPPVAIYFFEEGGEGRGGEPLLIQSLLLAEILLWSY